MATKKKTTKKTRRKVAGRSSVKRRTPGWIIMLVGMVIGLLFALLIYVNGWVPRPKLSETIPVAESSQSKSKKPIEDKSAELKIEQKNNFDFYETLQDMEVVIDDEELTQTDDRKSKSFIIQLGAFKKREDAEALKAQVAFIGYTTAIQNTVDANKTQWHRVRLGPYTSGRKTEVIKRRLESNGFNAIVLTESTTNI